MKRTWMLMVLAAAAVAATASAQSLRADIPFDFSAGGRYMAAGTYEISVLTGNGPSGIVVRNRESKKSLMAMSRTTTSDVAGKALLVFQCQTGSCAIAQVLTPNGMKRTFATPKLRGPEKERSVAIRMTPQGAGSGF